MTRLLAVVAAVGMIAGAFVYRYGVPGGGGSGGNDRDDGGETTPRAAVVCAQELGAVCDALGGEGSVVVEPIADTASRLIAARGAGDAAIAGWVAVDPWPAMVDAERARTSKPRLFAAAKDVEGVASTPVVVVTRKGQAIPGCTGEVTWRCVGDAAQSPAFRFGADTAEPTRLAIRAAALNGLLGRTDWAANDLDLPSAEGQPDPRSWIAAVDDRFAQAVGFGARSLQDFVLQQGSANAFATTGVVARGAPPASFDVATPSPRVTIAVTYTPAGRDGRDLDVGPLRDPLRDAGWEVRPNARTEGLPSPGVLFALRGVS